MACREVEMGKVLCVMWGCVCVCGDVCVHVGMCVCSGDVCVHVGKGRARGRVYMYVSMLSHVRVYIYICDQTYAYSIVLFFFFVLECDTLID